MSDIEKARERIGQVHRRSWSGQLSDELRRIVDAKPSQEALLDFLTDFRTQLRDVEDELARRFSQSGHTEKASRS